MGFLLGRAELGDQLLNSVDVVNALQAVDAGQNKHGRLLCNRSDGLPGVFIQPDHLHLVEAGKDGLKFFEQHRFLTGGTAQDVDIQEQLRELHFRLLPPGIGQVEHALFVPLQEPQVYNGLVLGEELPVRFLFTLEGNHLLALVDDQLVPTEGQDGIQHILVIFGEVIQPSGFVIVASGDEPAGKELLDESPPHIKVFALGKCR